MEKCTRKLGDGISTTKLKNQVFSDLIKFIRNNEYLDHPNKPKYLPFTSKKFTFKEIDRKELNNLESLMENDECDKFEILDSKEIVIFQDELGNYIQLESYGRESILIRHIIGLNQPEFLGKTLELFKSVEKYLIISLGEVPPLYIKMVPGIEFGFNEEREFNNILSIFDELLGFTIQLVNNKDQTALLYRSSQPNHTTYA